MDDADPMDDLMDLLTYTCPQSGKKRVAGMFENGTNKVAKRPG